LINIQFVIETKKRGGGQLVKSEASKMVLGTLLKHSVLILVTVTIFRYLIFPFLLELVLQVRIRSVSPRSIRGIEWSSKRNGCKELSPRLKLERIGLQKSKRKGGLLTISIEGLTIYLTRVAEDNQSDSDHDVKPDHSTATKRDRKRRGSSGSAISFIVSEKEIKLLGGVVADPRGPSRTRS
jgi:hypothetical protein